MKLEAAGNTQSDTAAVSNDNHPKENEDSASSDLVEFHVEYDNVDSKDQSGVGSGCRSYDQYCLDQYCFRLGWLSDMLPWLLWFDAQVTMCTCVQMNSSRLLQE